MILSLGDSSANHDAIMVSRCNYRRTFSVNSVRSIVTHCKLWINLNFIRAFVFMIFDSSADFITALAKYGDTIVAKRVVNTRDINALFGVRLVDLRLNTLFLAVRMSMIVYIDIYIFILTAVVIHSADVVDR